MVNKVTDKKELHDDEKEPVTEEESTAKNDVPVKDEPLNENEDKNNQSEDENNLNSEEPTVEGKQPVKDELPDENEDNNNQIEDENNTNGEEESDASNDETEEIELKTINLDDLVPFEGRNPFKLYKGEKHDTMLKSIRANGIREPITVRPYSKQEGKYEIISGHNRVSIGREAGLKETKAIVKNLENYEAELELTSSNLNQRKPEDITPSELASAYAIQYNEIEKHPGKRTDLIKKSAELTSDSKEQGLKAREQVASELGFSESKLWRYLCADKLIPQLKSRFDEKKFGLNVAEKLSSLTENEQEMLDVLFGKDDKFKIKICQADLLKKESAKKKSKETELTEADIREILKPEEATKNVKSNIKPIKSGEKKWSWRFIKGESEEERDNLIDKLLERYFNEITKDEQP